MSRQHPLDKENLDPPMTDKPLDDKNNRTTKFHPDVQDPMNAIEPDSLNKQRKLDQYNNGSVGQSKVPDVKEDEDERNLDGAIIASVISKKTIDDKTLQRQLDPAASNDQEDNKASETEEIKAMVRVEKHGEEYNDANGVARKEHDGAGEEKSDDGEPLDAIQPEVLDSKTVNDGPHTKILLNKPYAKEYKDTGELNIAENLALPIRDQDADPDKDEDSNADPMDLVQKEVLLSKIPADSPESRRAATIKDQLEEEKRDNSVLDKGKTLITNKGAMNSVEESTVGNKKVEDEQLTNKQTTIQKKEVTQSEDNKAIAPPAAPVIIKGQTLEEDPLDYVNSAVIDKRGSDDPAKDQPVIAIGRGESKVNEEQNLDKQPVGENEDEKDPMDYVESKVITDKMPKDLLEKSKTTNVKKTPLEERKIIAPIPIEATRSTLVNNTAKDKNFTSEASKVGIVPHVPTKGVEQPEESPMGEDPIEYVDPQVLTNKMPESPVKGEDAKARDNRAPGFVDQVDEPRQLKNDALPIVSEQMDDGRDSNHSNDPMEAIEPGVFDSPVNKKTPIEILREYGYDITSHQMNDVIVIDPPIRSVEQLGNVRFTQNLNQIELNA